jgi:hypothetical protein
VVIEFSTDGSTLTSVFELAGRKEPALTGALGFTLAHSQPFLEQFLADVHDTPLHVTSIALELHDDDTAGRTDVELVTDDGERVIIEAKRGWIVPTEQQLRTYAARRPMRIIVVTDCTDTFAAAIGLATDSEGIPVVHRSWRDVLQSARTCRQNQWTRQLTTYLEASVATQQNKDSNWVYCVTVGPIPGLAGQHGRDFIDGDVYFHPYGPGWPKQPPNYLAFRQHGAVFTVRHVDSFELVNDLRDVADDVGIGTVLEEITGPHVVYRLGPHIGPTPPLKTGTNYRAARHWVHLDLFLTSETYKDALAATKWRHEQR